MLLCIILPSIADPTLTTDSVAEVMELVNDWKSLNHYYITQIVVPDTRLREIQQRCSTQRDIAHECASYYIHCHPQSSWIHLAGRLYRQGEFTAVEKLKPFLPLRGKSQGISYAMLVYTAILSNWPFICTYKDYYLYTVSITCLSVLAVTCYWLTIYHWPSSTTHYPLWGCLLMLSLQYLPCSQKFSLGEILPFSPQLSLANLYPVIFCPC